MRLISHSHATVARSASLRLLDLGGKKLYIVRGIVGVSESESSAHLMSQFGLCELGAITQRLIDDAEKQWFDIN